MLTETYRTGQADKIELLVDLNNCNIKIICEKHARYWQEQQYREEEKKVTMCCEVGGDDCKNCQMENCEHECHKLGVNNRRTD